MQYSQIKTCNIENREGERSRDQKLQDLKKKPSDTERGYEYTKKEAEKERGDKFKSFKKKFCKPKTLLEW